MRSHSHTLLDDAKLYSLYSQNTQSFRDCGNELFTSTCRVRGIEKEYIQEKIQGPYTAVLNTSPPTDSRWVLTLPTYSHPWRWGYVLRVERLYCKRPILRLASSKILTPHPPRRPASVYPPPLVRGEDTLAGWRGGWGVNILEDARHSSVLYIRKYFVVLNIL